MCGKLREKKIEVKKVEREIEIVSEKKEVRGGEE
jgi:hypothetical protein